jgi:Na+-driven multidrug efflux pump
VKFDRKKAKRAVNQAFWATVLSLFAISLVLAFR